MSDNVNLEGNTEIQNALKEFEAKSGVSPEASKSPGTPPMVGNRDISGVKFETDSYKVVKFYNEPDTPKIVKLTMKYSGGAVKDERQAEYTLFGFVVIAIIISLYLFFGLGSGGDEGAARRAMLELHPELINQ